MDIIILCHTEFGFVHEGVVIFEKSATTGATEGAKNLAIIADKYGAKITYAVMPEVARYFPRTIDHEICLHIHPGLEEFVLKGFRYVVGDLYLRQNCEQSVNSTVLRDYSYKEQLGMIKFGKEYLTSLFHSEPKSFVAGRWSINNDTVKALIEVGITQECSAAAHSKAPHYDWSKLPRICMPYHPSEQDYQAKGSLPLLIVPVSQMFPSINMTLEFIPDVGLSWLKACFKEYYTQDLPFLHICLHSPCMTDTYFISAMDELLRFISSHKNVNFKFASDITEYVNVDPKTLILPYLLSTNQTIIRTFIKSIIHRKQ